MAKVKNIYVFMVALLLCLSVSANAFAAVGYVEKIKGDYIIVETSSGYTCAELYSGWYYISEGTKLLGNMNSFCFQDWCTSNGNEVKVYVDDYMLSREQALQWLYSHSY